MSRRRKRIACRCELCEPANYVTNSESKAYSRKPTNAKHTLIQNKGQVQLGSLGPTCGSWEVRQSAQPEIPRLAQTISNASGKTRIANIVGAPPADARSFSQVSNSRSAPDNISPQVTESPGSRRFAPDAAGTSR
jgi:hypothetical protein